MKQKQKFVFNKEQNRLRAFNHNNPELFKISFKYACPQVFVLKYEHLYQIRCPYWKWQVERIPFIWHLSFQKPIERLNKLNLCVSEWRIFQKMKITFWVIIIIFV